MTPMRVPISNLKRAIKASRGSQGAFPAFRPARGPATAAALESGVLIDPPLTPSPLWKRVYAHRYVYLILLPGLVFFAIFAYVPMYGIQLAFKDYNIAK